MVESFRYAYAANGDAKALIRDCLAQIGDIPAGSTELKMISQALGDFPLVGFFANGELYNGRLYGYTGVLTLFL